MKDRLDSMYNSLDGNIIINDNDTIKIKLHNRNKKDKRGDSVSFIHISL